MKTVSVGRRRLRYSKEMDMFEAGIKLSGRTVALQISKNEDSQAELLELAEATLDEWDAMIARVLRVAKQKSVEDDYLSASAAKKLTVKDLEPTTVGFIDDGDGPYIEIALDLQCWFTEPDDGRQARYTEDPDDGSAEIEVYTF